MIIIVFEPADHSNVQDELGQRFDTINKCYYCVHSNYIEQEVYPCFLKEVLEADYKQYQEKENIEAWIISTNSADVLHLLDNLVDLTTVSNSGELELYFEGKLVESEEAHEKMKSYMEVD